MMRYLLLFLIELFLVFGCGKKEKPIEPEMKGRLVVNSAPAGARIVIDDLYTGKVTPDSFELDEGRYEIKVYLIGYRCDSVNVEIRKGERVPVFLTLQPESLSGLIYVESFPSGAELIVDYQNIGVFSPDTLRLPIGWHILSLRLEDFRSPPDIFIEVFEDSLVPVYAELQPVKSVLVEYFGNVSCQACGEVERFVHNLDIHYDRRVNVISYHARFPYPLDPFYTYNPVDNQARINFYSVVSLPEIVVDGDKIQDPTDSSLFHAVVTRKLGSDAFVGFVGKTRIDDGNLCVFLKIYGYSEISGELYAALVENYVHFDSPPGSNGETEFFSVMRKLYSLGSIGLSRGAVIEKEFSFEIPGYLPDCFSVIVFAQGREKEIYQCGHIR